MSSTPPSGGIVFVEPLESRIAPTGFYASNALLAGDPADATATSNPHYLTFATQPTASMPGFVPASAYGINVPNLYALKLTGSTTFDANTGFSTGDELVVFNATTGFNTNLPLIQANKGPVVAFFLDSPNSHGTTTEIGGQVYADEMVGVSVGKKDILTINGNVHGDIVSNLLGGGTTISLTSVGKPNQGLAGLTMNGNVFSDLTETGYGSILAGGNIKNVTLAGTVNHILAGTATNGQTFNFSGAAGGVTGTIASAPVDGHAGSNITTVTVNAFAAGGRIQAGDAGFAGIGGAISGLQVLSDTNAFSILGGTGGFGNAGTAGGAGGAVTDVLIPGAAASVANSLILIEGGQGGVNPEAHGGAGGAVSGVGVGFSTFDPTMNNGMISGDLLAQNVMVEGGTGGGGIQGGNGGTVSVTQVIGSMPDDGATAADGSANAEIQILGGAGGTALATDHGKGGRGGNINSVTAENVDPAALTSSLLIQGGAGGAVKAGGNITAATLLGANLTVAGGAGGTGIGHGGAGGSLDTVAILSLTDLFAHQVTLNGGVGGNATNGAGGAGGSIDTVNMADADLTALTINGGTHGNGGSSANGAGGNGGAVTNVILANSAPSAAVGVVAVRSGAGGNGATAGGAGGSFDTFQFVGVDFSFNLTAGGGGSAAGAGNGGAGGGLSNIGITNAPTDAVIITDNTLLGQLGGTVSSGAGGNGAGGLGGAGGNLAGVNVRAAFNLAMTAGNAGNGAAGAGAGGGFDAATAVSLQGLVSVAAGTGGQSSGSASDGGTINGVVAAAAPILTFLAGYGGSGGAGGSITNSGTSNDELTGVQVGNLLVTAGKGSNLGSISGGGGNIMGFTGLVANGDAATATTAMTAFTAGVGGGGSASARGGNIDTVKLTGSSNALSLSNQIITLDGGNGGSAGGAARGRAGGSVSNVTIYDLDAGTLVQHIAGGDGGTGARKGGAGGDIANINVGVPGDGGPNDIGIRSGVAYGYAVGGAGGIFAGVGGAGNRHNGANGSVTDITANAISSIVAGKGSVQLCTEVDGVYLDGLTATTADATGAFTNFATANLVGSVFNAGNGPTAAGASTFQAGDGLIATANLTSNRNFVPEALFTVNAAGSPQLVDYVQPALNPVVSAPPAFLA